MTGAAAPLRRERMGDVGLWVAVAFAVISALIVEWMAVKVVPGTRGGRDWFALSLFVVPLLISLGAIALMLASRPLWIRWVSAIVILLVPPAVLFGVFHG